MRELVSSKSSLRQRIVLTNFPDASLHSGATIVEVPHSGWRQRQVCVPGSIGFKGQNAPDLGT